MVKLTNNGKMGLGIVCKCMSLANTRESNAMDCRQGCTGNSKNNAFQR